MPQLVGRETELALVEAFMAGDGGAALAVLGEPGIGKTTLWSEAVSLARSAGALVLVARPAESEARLSFAGLTDLLSEVGTDVLSALPSPQRAALDVALLRSEAGRPPERRLVGTAVLSLLRELALERDVVLALDDVQWLDGPSAAALAFAFRRLAGERVRAIVSVRSEDAERSWVGSLGRDVAIQPLELGPLSLAALHRVVVDGLGHSFPRPTLVRIAQASGGNPLYALEIARLLDREDAQRDAPLPVPDGLNALVTRRLRALPAPTRHALLVASALARPDLSLVDRRALEPAEQAGLVRVRGDRRVEFAHPLFASAVYASASPGSRRETHRSLAAGVSDPEERARHLALGCDGPDAEVALEVRAAARRARLRGAPDAAAELTGLALRLVPADGQAADELRFELAEQLYLASDFLRAAELLRDLIATLPTGDLRARALLTLADVDYWHRGESAALALGEQALAAAGDELLQARCHAAIAMWAGTVDLPRAAASARAALALLDGHEDADPALVAAALAARVRADLFLGRGLDREAAERALALESGAPPAAVDTRVVFKLGQWLRYVDDLDGARARLAEAERQAQDEGDESSLANILLNRLICETWAGEWETAAQLTARMREAFEQQGVEPGGLAPWLAYLDAHAGRLDAVRAAAGPTPPAEPIVAAIWARCLGLAELAAGDPAAADRHLSDALAGLDRVDFREPAIWRIDGDAIEAALGCGEPARARTLLARFEERTARSPIPWSLAVAGRCRGLVLAGDGALEEAALALEGALLEHARCPMPFERARTLLAQGQVLRRLKRKREARGSLEAALAVFEGLGTEAWARRAELELSRVAVRRAPAELSATELRIARLAAAGQTNQAIAAEVFLTRKAVEANLARAYRKLGIRSRAQLARALDALDRSSAQREGG